MAAAWEEKVKSTHTQYKLSFLTQATTGGGGGEEKQNRRADSFPSFVHLSSSSSFRVPILGECGRRIDPRVSPGGGGEGGGGGITMISLNEHHE